MSDQLPSSNVTDDTILEHARAVMASKRALEEASGRHRNTLKRAKDAGVTTSTLNRVIAEHREDPAVVWARQREEVRYRRLLIAADPEQLSLDVQEPAPTEKSRGEFREFEIEDRGYCDGKAGISPETSGYDPGTNFHAVYMRGWQRGQAYIAEQMKPGGEKVGGRRAGSGEPAEARAGRGGRKKDADKAAEKPEAEAAGEDAAAGLDETTLH
jgi:hypothetical protein